MTLAAQTVVTHVVDRLKTVSATGGRAYDSRDWPLAESALPAWVVTAGDEQVETIGLTYPAQQQHVLQIQARAVTRAVVVGEGVDPALNALVAAGLTALFASAPPYQLNVIGITRDRHSEGESATGEAVITLAATYHTRQNAPETIL